MSEALVGLPNGSDADDSGLRRWWIYQRERFPLLAHGPLILAFSASGVSYSAALRGASKPAIATIVAAFATALCFFFQLRVADEIKDASDDARYRPYRPVPRGLVTLGELRALGFLAAGVQLAVAAMVDVRLLGILVAVWAYMALMRVEFFAGEWLRRRPLTVLWTHMLVMPLIDLYVTACDWLPAGDSVARGLKWFLVTSFFNGIVVEIGRKVRAPEDEEPGVDTYSSLWGRRRAVTAFLGVMAAAMAFALLAAGETGAATWVGLLLGAMWLVALGAGSAFVRDPRPFTGRRIEAIAGVWTLLVYLSLGIAPWVSRHG